MMRRMSMRIPTHLAATLKPLIGRAVTGELLDVSFDGAFFVPVDKPPETLLERHVRIRWRGTAADDTPLDIPARVVEVHENGVGLEFEGYGDTVNAYLERVYAERLTRESESLSFWS